MNKHPISVAGFDRLLARIRHLKETERPLILEAVQKARDLGDLSENADYKTARADQRQIDAEIRDLENLANNANVIDTKALSGDCVMFGSLVTLEGEDGKKVKYRILSEYEADLSQNIIANTSPLARALIGKKAGADCIVRTPAGEKEYVITDIEYGD